MKRRRKTRKPPRDPAFAGLTAANCCAGCTAKNCLISGNAYCGHPHKGGLQSADMCRVAAVKRLEAAAKILQPVRAVFE